MHMCPNMLGFAQRFLLAIVICLFSLLAHGQQELNASSVSQAELEIERVNKEFIELSDSLLDIEGDRKEALQLQLYHKSGALRVLLKSAISKQSVHQDKLIELINSQQEYAQEAAKYLEDRLKALDETIKHASSEERLVLLTDYQELQRYLDVVNEGKWQNIQWLTSLGVNQDDAKRRLKTFVEKQLRVTSASVDYYNQQVDIVGKQISERPDSEKSALQLSELVLKQRLEIATDSLRSLISIAESLDIATADYKRLVFEVTGSITQDLFDGKVIIAILSKWLDNVWNWLANNAPQHLIQLLVFIVILIITKLLVTPARFLVGKAVVAENLKISHLMQDFFIAVSGYLVWIVGIMVGLSQVGLDLTPVLTGFGIAGVVVGFALQDTLSNFLAGMALLIGRPFDVGDVVFAGGVDGKVSHMSLVNTTIRTFDNQIIIVPNSKIWGDIIKNVTHERVRRVDMVFGIGYADDLLKAESVLLDIITSHPSVLRAPEPTVKVHTLNTSSVDFIVRPWVKTDDYWDVYWDVTKEVKLRFDCEGISIPFPQQDVHLNIVKNDDTPEN